MVVIKPCDFGHLNIQKCASVLSYSNLDKQVRIVGMLI